VDIVVHIDLSCTIYLRYCYYFLELEKVYSSLQCLFISLLYVSILKYYDCYVIKHWPLIHSIPDLYWFCESQDSCCSWLCWNCNWGMPQLLLFKKLKINTFNRRNLYDLKNVKSLWFVIDFSLNAQFFSCNLIQTRWSPWHLVILYM
jgi:hypothetical protein